MLSYAPKQIWICAPTGTVLNLGRACGRPSEEPEWPEAIAMERRRRPIAGLSNPCYNAAKISPGETGYAQGSDKAHYQGNRHLRRD